MNAEERRAVAILIEDTDRVMRRLRLLRRREREEWRALWAPVTMCLYERDAARFAAKRTREVYRHAA